MAEFRFLDTNRFFNTGYTLSATSEAPDFPVENLQKHSRSFSWRSKSDGHFTVVAGVNDNIQFTTGAGTLAPFIATGTYDATGLAAAIKTAMEGVSGDTFTVSYSITTGKWTISTSGVTLSLLWTWPVFITRQIGSTIGFDTSSDDTGSTSYTGDYVAHHEYDRIVLDAGAAITNDSFAMFFNPLNDIQLSTSAVVKIEANATDVWTAPSVSETVVINQDFEAGSFFFTSDKTYRYWSIYIEDPTNTDLFVELNCVYLSDARVLTQPPEIGLKDIINDKSKKNTNEYGHEYWDRYPLRKSAAFGYKIIDETDRQSLKEMFKLVGNHTPIVVVFDQLETVFGDKEEFMIYGRIDGKWDASQVFLTYFDLGFTILEAI